MSCYALQYTKLTFESFPPYSFAPSAMLLLLIVENGEVRHNVHTFRETVILFKNANVETHTHTHTQCAYVGVPTWIFFIEMAVG